MTRLFLIQYASPVKPELSGTVGLTQSAGWYLAHPVSDSSWTGVGLVESVSRTVGNGFRSIQEFSKCVDQAVLLSEGSVHGFSSTFLACERTLWWCAPLCCLSPKYQWALMAAPSFLWTLGVLWQHGSQGLSGMAGCMLGCPLEEGHLSRLFLEVERFLAATEPW